MSKYVKQVNGNITNTHTGRTYTATQWAKKVAKRDARATARGEKLPAVKLIVAGKVTTVKEATKPAQAKRIAKVDNTVKAPQRKAIRQHERRSAAAKASWAKRKAAAKGRLTAAANVQPSVEYVDHEGNVLAAADVPARARRQFVGGEFV